MANSMWSAYCAQNELIFGNRWNKETRSNVTFGKSNGIEIALRTAVRVTLMERHFKQQQKHTEII